jgi:phosphate transport system substrate-binding protein
MKMLSLGKKSFTLIASALLSTVLLTACGSSRENSQGSGTAAGNSANGSNLSGTVTVSGSTSVQPLAQDLADIFNETYPDISVEIQGGGSSQGIKDVTDSTSDIGESSRDLTPEEKTGLTEHVIAYDGIAVVVNPANTVADLSKEQIQKIFNGEITNWKDVGGKDEQILVVAREASSGTKTAFEELMGLQEKQDGKTVSLVRKDALVADGNGPVKANISSKENAIGYLSLGFADNTVKKVSIGGVECSVENVKSKSYPISRPFLMLTKGDVSPVTQAFLDFVKSDAGQEIVGKSTLQ